MFVVVLRGNRLGKLDCVSYVANSFYSYLIYRISCLDHNRRKKYLVVERI